MKKQISVLMIACQISMGLFSTGAYAGSPEASPAPTAEDVMLANLMAMQGTHVTGDAAVTTINNIVTQYDATAPRDGREQRLQDALVTLNIFTPDQASKFIEKSHRAQSTIEAASPIRSQRRDDSGNHRAFANHAKSCTVFDKRLLARLYWRGSRLLRWDFHDPRRKLDSPIQSDLHLLRSRSSHRHYPGRRIQSRNLGQHHLHQPGDHPHAAEGDLLNVAGVGILAATVFLMYKAGGDCN